MFKIPTNSKPMQTIKKKLLDSIYPEIMCQAEEITSNSSKPTPSLVEGSIICNSHASKLLKCNQEKEEQKLSKAM